MDFQNLIVIAMLILAAFILLKRVLRYRTRTSGSACGSCAGCSKNTISSPPDGLVQLGSTESRFTQDSALGITSVGDAGKTGQTRGSELWGKPVRST